MLRSLSCTASGNSADHGHFEEWFRAALANHAIPLEDRVRIACAFQAVMGVLELGGDDFSEIPRATLAALLRKVVNDLLGRPGKLESLGSPQKMPVPLSPAAAYRSTRAVRFPGHARRPWKPGLCERSAKGQTGTVGVIACAPPPPPSQGRFLLHLGARVKPIQAELSTYLPDSKLRHQALR